ncbi:MAG: hypothetical protein ACR2HG_07400 [Pyrinomonadaceae bacterium]
MTPEEIINEIRKLPPVQKKEVFDSFSNAMNKPSVTEEEFLRILLAEGVISEIPDFENYTDQDDDFEPIEIEGEPVSEIIIKERR